MMIKYKYKCKFQTECHWPLSFAKIGGIGNCWTAGCYARWTRLARYFCRLTYSAERCGAPPCGEDEKRIVSSLIGAVKWELYRLRKCAFFVAKRVEVRISKCNNERLNGIYKFQHQRALGVQLLDERT